MAKKSKRTIQIRNPRHLALIFTLVFGLIGGFYFVYSSHAQLQTLAGAYSGGINPSGVDNFAKNYLDKSSADLALEFGAGDTWAGISGPSWQLDPWANSNYKQKLVLSVPMLPGNEGTVSLATGAQGTYNSYFKVLAQNLINRGMNNTVIRPGWEFNGGWYKWSAKDNTANFINYWQQIVKTMRGVSGANFTFVWNPTNGYGQFPADQAYPGDSYVDYIGDDVYNNSWISNYTDPVARWNDIYSGDHGLSFWIDFAFAHGKPLAFPEWGTGTRPDGHGGGDDTLFMTNMYNVMSSHLTAFQIYWDYCASDYCASLSNNPKSAAVYKQLFVGSPAPTPAPVPTPVPAPTPTPSPTPEPTPTPPAPVPTTPPADPPPPVTPTPPPTTLPPVTIKKYTGSVARYVSSTKIVSVKQTGSLVYTVSWTGRAKLGLSIYDPSGKLVLHIPASSKPITGSLQTATSGKYKFKITSTSFRRTAYILTIQ